MKKMNIEDDPYKLKAELETKVKRTVSDLKNIFVEKVETPRAQVPPTPGRAAIRTGGVKDIMSKFNKD